MALEPDEGGCVTKRFVIFTTPGWIPEKKGGWLKDDQLIDFLREVVLHDGWKPGFRATVLKLTWDNDLWVSEAVGHLWEHDNAIGPRRARKAWKEARARHERIYKTAPAAKIGSEVEAFRLLTKPYAAPQPLQGGEVTREAVARAIGAVPVNMNIDIAGLISDGSPSADLNAVLGEAAERVLALIQAPLPGDLAELEALAKAAGSGGWRIGGSGYVVTGGKGADVKPVADFLANPEPDVFKAGPTLSEAMDRAKYVVAACNAAPGLISRIAALSADNARLREEREFKEIMDGADAAIALSTGKGGEE